MRSPKIVGLLGICLTGLLIWFTGCGNSQLPTNNTGIEDDKSVTVKLCTKCGEIKGSESCCKVEGKTLCSKCGMIKGSPGCCKITEGNDEICLKCGFIKGSDDCCKVQGKEKCSKCGLVKGSPGCCKIPGKTDK